ncbi:MAG TPA: DUF6807 family protein [Niabella sp.]|nr:DUF6807 family protein [Niabella sp.]
MRTCFAVVILGVLSFMGCIEKAGLTYEKNEEGYLLKEGAQPVLFFQVKPKSINGRFERSGYVHPLYNWEGDTLTQDGPADHPHHRGIFWAWHQVLWKGRMVGDSWISDKIRFVPGESRIISGKEHLILESELQWLADSIYAGDKSLIREQVKIKVHKATAGYRLIDFSIALFPLKDSVAIGGSSDIKGYGGFSARWKLPPDLQFASGGVVLKPREAAVEGEPWVSFTGSFIGNKTESVTLFCKAAYPGPRQWWILRGPEETSMQNAVFPGATPVLLPKDGLHLRYRLLVQKHVLETEVIRKLFEDYQHEPDR